MVTLIRFVLIINALGFLLSGVKTLSDVESVAKLVGFHLSTPSGYNEFWASYGGMFFGFGAYLLWASFRDSHREPAITILTLCCLGLVSGRLVGIATFGLPQASHLFFLAWELVTLVLGASYFIQRWNLLRRSSV